MKKKKIILILIVFLIFEFMFYSNVFAISEIKTNMKPANDPGGLTGGDTRDY